ncbi:uncharacterized protein CTRU02_205340 [Colletotrichum truncatum]|uniref:Uncharacterized protein n=1 Tax=Colletotrichum truncatum TaxID=5467 RepID=A0ACC3Z422_COLTU
MSQTTKVAPRVSHFGFLYDVEIVSIAIVGYEAVCVSIHDRTLGSGSPPPPLLLSL